LRRRRLPDSSVRLNNPFARVAYAADRLGLLTRASFDRPCSDAPSLSTPKSAACVQTPLIPDEFSPCLEAAFPTTVRCLTFHVARRTPHSDSHPNAIARITRPKTRDSQFIRFARSSARPPLFKGRPAATPERLTPSIRPEGSSPSVQLQNPPGLGSLKAPAPASPKSSTDVRTNEVVCFLPS